MKEQFINVSEYGTKLYYSDREMKILHREDGPAIEWANRYKAWFINDKRHREDGPAVEYANGTKLWYINGRPHREDGPAVEYADGAKEWWVDNQRLTEDEFNARMNPVELTLEDIGVSVGKAMDAMPCSPKIIQLLLTPNDSNWQGMLLGLADNGDTYRLDDTDGWVIWFDGISKENADGDSSAAAD